jgi:hypothetical protein
MDPRFRGEDGENVSGRFLAKNGPIAVEQQQLVVLLFADLQAELPHPLRIVVDVVEGVPGE